LIALLQHRLHAPNSAGFTALSGPYYVNRVWDVFDGRQYRFRAVP
jgi:cytochrome c